MAANVERKVELATETKLPHGDTSGSAEGVSSSYLPPDADEALINNEKEALRPGREVRRGIKDDRVWKGLALSGGGIRAATFALGAIQAFAAKNILKQVDYVSSVSGGGYISSSLQWWWSAARSDEEAAERKKIARQRREESTPPTRFGLDNLTFPYGTGHLGNAADETTEQRQNLKYLRNHGYYLTPGKGLSAMALFAVVLRTVFLSLLIWLPLAVFFFTAANLIDHAFVNPWFGANSPGNELGDFIGKILPVTWVGECKGPACALAYRPLYAIFFGLWLATLAIFAFVTLLLGLVSRAADNTNTGKRFLRLSVATAGVGLAIYVWRMSPQNFNIDKILTDSFAALIFVLSAGTLVFGLFPQWSSNWSYAFRRAVEKLLGSMFLPSFLFLLISTIPLPAYFVFHYLYESSGAPSILLLPLSTISGAISALYAYYNVLEKSEPGLAGRILAPVGAAFFIYGLLTTTYFAGVVCYQAIVPENPTAPFFADGSTRSAVQIVALCTLIVTLALFFSVNVNYVGLHRFYRDRLMETFMPSFKAVKGEQVKPSYGADRLKLSELTSWSIADNNKGATGPMPYPIINTFAILTDDSDATVAARGGSNFIFSPLYSGCDVSGWLATKEYEQLFGPQTLASAMAASGAAVNSNAGYIGTGITRNRIVSFVMTLLNMRLGIWTGNPLARTAWNRRVPTFFAPVFFYGLFGNKRRRDRTFIEISDGGNFENLGIYELIRRKLSLIIVVDAEADGTLGLPAFVSAIQRVQEDFNARIEFTSSKGPERFIPVSARRPVAYPEGAGFATSPFLLANVRYSDGSSGLIIYIKATLIKNLEFLTYGYKAKNPTFPHQTTVDQFFDPAQFEAYRDLGYRSAAVMCDTLDLEKTMNDLDQIQAKY